MTEIILKPGREKSILRNHPWIFSGAVDKVIGSPVVGETVDVLTNGGTFLAKAMFNTNSTITARVWTLDQNENVDSSLLSKRIKKAIEYRLENKYLMAKSNAMRLINGESDGIPGLILDKYDDTYVVQFLTAGVEYWRKEIIEIIVAITLPKVLYERSDMDVRKLEGLDLKNELIYGHFDSEDVVISENKIDFLVNIVRGHKTGFYLDQRDNRFLLHDIVEGLSVLDCFCYTGGFSLNALNGNARDVTLVDSSNQALSYARENIIKNHLPLGKVKFIEKDVFTYLRTLRDIGIDFDLIILDPPKFAPTGSQVERATRAYKDINLLALKLLRTGGILLTFSCSGGVSEELFQKIIAGAALDAGAHAVILNRLHQSADHPVGLNFPEGAYLKGFIIQKR